MMIALGIYCGMAWMFMGLTFYLIPGRTTWVDYVRVIFAPISFPIIVGYELWTKQSKP